MPLDVEIPDISTAGTEASARTATPQNSDDDDESAYDSEDVIEHAMDDHCNNPVEEDNASVASAPKEEYEQDEVIARTPTGLNIDKGCLEVTPEPTPVSHNLATLMYEEDRKGPPLPQFSPNSMNDETSKLSAIEFPTLVHKTKMRTASLTIPEDEVIEESKEETESIHSSDQMVTNLDDDATVGTDGKANPIPLTRRESFSTVGSEYTFEDDSTIDNACPICLSGYKYGNTIIVSKHCIHQFHKECILEWLETHNDCPVCRVCMVSENEMNKAATSIVGKTRMYRAVASMPHRSSHRPLQRSPTSSPEERAQNSPFHGTVRRAAAQSASVYSNRYS